jgi:hypothetical protein
MSFIGTAVIGSAVLGASATVYGANKAAEAQKDAAKTAADTSLNMYSTTRGDLAPYRQIGQTASTDLTNRLSELTSPISVDPNQLENSDYYKFASTQGQRGATNSAAARGLGSSGAALKGATAFAKGLATDTYKTSFDMANTNQSNAYNRLKSLVDTGENASAQTGTAGTAAANTAAGAQIGAGNAQAAAANATGSALSNAASNIGGYAAYKGLYGSNGSSNPSMAGSPTSPYYAPLNG